MIAEVASGLVFGAVALSGTSTVYSGSRLDAQPVASNAMGTDCNGAGSISFAGVFTSTPNGTLTIEYSNSHDREFLRGTEVWDTYDLVTGGGFVSGVAVVTAGQIAGKATFGISVRARFRRFRLKYTNASGSGTLTVYATVKAAA